jgi:hypothetical protein
MSIVPGPAMEEGAIALKEAIFRRSTRIVTKMLPKVTKELPKKGPIKATIQTKGAQLEKILSSKTSGSKIEKRSLTSEEIEEDMILMGILPATESKLRSPLQTDSERWSQSSSTHMTSTANNTNQELPGTSNISTEAKVPQPGMFPYSLKISIRI